MLSADGIGVRPAASGVLIVPAEFTVQPCGTSIQGILNIEPLVAAFGFRAAVDQGEMADRRPRPTDAHANRAAGEDLLLNPGECQRTRGRGRGQPADDPERLFQILRPIAGVGLGAAIRFAPGHPGRQFALTPGGVGIVVAAYARGDRSPAPFTLQLTLQLKREPRHDSRLLSAGTHGFGRTSAGCGGSFCLRFRCDFRPCRCRRFFRGALLRLLFLHAVSLLLIFESMDLTRC
jgi:hypothetical protein